MLFKKVVSKLHLWLGLSSGLVVFIIATTGCIYAFKEEIQNLTQPYRFTKTQNTELLAPSFLKVYAEDQLPNKHIHSVTYYSKDKSAEVSFFNRSPKYFYKVYINPSTGEVLKVKNMDEDFFRFILMGHFYLWLPIKIGQPVIATATLIFVVMIVSGIILWWPKNKNAKRQRFSIKWDSKWKRKNYDLHNVFGFYVAFFALVLALTGLVWGFEWFANGVYKGLSGGKDLVKYYEPKSDTSNINNPLIPSIDRIYKKMKAEYPNAASIEIHYPDTKSSSIAASANPDEGTYWKNDFRYFDQYSLKEISVTHRYGRFHEAQMADTIMRMNYDIHVGAILGLPGKILAFFASLIVASLPITGFLIWKGRKKLKL